MTGLIVRIHTWLAAHAAAVRSEDRGALSTESALITALLAAGAIGVVGAIVAAANGWADSIPGAPGG
jgi:hypothetical protein